MTITPAASSPIDLLPADVAGSAAPSDAPDGAFASLVAQLSGGAAPSTPASAPGTRARNAASGDDDAAAEAAAKRLATDDPNDPAALAAALPPWVWALNEPPRNMPAPSVPFSSMIGAGAAVDSADEAPASTASDNASSDAAAFAALAIQIQPSLANGSASSPATESSSSASPAPNQLPSLAPSAVPQAAAFATAPDSAAGSAAPTANAAASTIETSSQPSASTTETALGSQNLSTTAGTTPSANSSAAPGRSDATATTPAAAAPGQRGSTSSSRVAGPQAEGTETETTAKLESKSAKAGSGSDAQAPPTLSDKARAAARQAIDAALRGKDAQVAAPDARTLPQVAPASEQAGNNAAREQGKGSSPAFAEAAETRKLEAPSSPVVQVLENAAAATVHTDHAAAFAGQTAIGHDTIDKSVAAAATTATTALTDTITRAAGIDDASLHRQMVQAIQLQSRNGVGDARLTLQPEYLGDVTIALRVEDGAVTAHVSAATAEVRSWLTAHESMLRQGLLEQGLTLDRLVVSDEPAPELRKDGHSSRRDQAPTDEQPRQQQRPRQRPETSTFEITV